MFQKQTSIFHEKMCTRNENCANVQRITEIFGKIIRIESNLRKTIWLWFETEKKQTNRGDVEIQYLFNLENGVWYLSYDEKPGLQHIK